MKPLFDMSDRNKIISNLEYPFKCSRCDCIFYKEGKRIRSFIKLKDSKNSFEYCSTSCSQQSKVVTVIEQCHQCNSNIEVTPGERKKSKSGRMFCNRSCSAKYNNTHKTIGTRKSKLECWIQDELANSHPLLEIHYNLLNAIGNELDIYIPSLNLAIEFNGIFHYKSIFGEEKFKKTQATDLKKKINCIKNNITLCIIDVSTYQRFTIQTAQPFLDAVVLIINARTSQLDV